MKRVFYIIMIIGIPIIIWFQYDRYRKFHPPKDYAFPINTDIDTNYHDPEVVLNYYKYALECETYARYCWKSHRVDVLAPNWEDPQEKAFAQTYNQMKATASVLEQRLLASSSMKADGYSHVEILRWEETGMDTQSYQMQQILEGRDGIVRLGEINDGVWRLQRLLNEKGYDIRIDGVFNQETLAALQSFQDTHNLKQTEGIDRETLEVLFQQ